jgi:DNA invertase Pin-like site-specific DNA recombinase
VLQKLLALLENGDMLVVVRMDRFARSTLSALTLIAELEKRGVRFKSLDIPECGNPLFLEFFRTFVLFFARWEQSVRRERQMAGIAKAKGDGKYKGRKPKINDKLLKDIKRLFYDRKYTKTDIAKSLGISKSTCCRAFKLLNQSKKDI